MIGKWLNRLKGGGGSEPKLRASDSLCDVVPPEQVAIYLDLWLEQAASLKQLRMHEYADRKLDMARGVTLESMKVDPEMALAWVNIARVQLASEDFAGAKETINVAKGLARRSNDKPMEEFASAVLFQVMRQQEPELNKNWVVAGEAKFKSMEDYKAWKDQFIARAFYVCQSCGHIILIAGEHCQHCHFAPSNADEENVAICLSTMYLHVSEMLDVALEIQRGRTPFDIIPRLRSIINEWNSTVSKRSGFIIDKAKFHSDDYLDFNLLDHCAACGAKIWTSRDVDCHQCGAIPDRPQLMKLAICVENVLQQFIWNLRRSNDENFMRFITLLVNIKYSSTRAQVGPTDAQRQSAPILLVKLSPIYTQNGAGVVRVKSIDEIEYEVLNQSAHKDIVPTMKYLVDELKHFAYLISDSVSLF